jgi:hypothetical protein
LIESIGIGGAIDRADRKAKQAGSRFSEMFVAASRLRSLIAGVSAVGAAYTGDGRGTAWSLCSYTVPIKTIYR